MNAKPESAAEPTEPSGESITAEGLVELKAEVSELEGTGRKEMAERIKGARELGDLKENADYHIAKEDQAHLETRIKRLRRRLRQAVVVEVEPEAEIKSFAFGRTAEVLEQGTGTVHTWTLVGSTEADLTSGRLSVESPIGRGLRDQPLGEDVSVETPGGQKTFRVQSLVG